MHTHTYCRPTLKVAITTDDKVKMQNKRKIYSYALSYLILSARGAVSVVALAFSLSACVGHLSTGERGCSHSHFKTTVSKFPLEERARMYNYPAQCIAQGVMESVVSVRFCITFSGWGLVARRAPRFAAYSTIVACRCLQMRPLVSSSRRQILWRFRY